MLDCGFSAKETLARLVRHERDAEALTAIVITHEHGDHCRGLASCARRLNLPVWMTPGTFSMLKHTLDGIPDINLFNPHETFTIDDIEVQPFPVPHDAREPSQFVFSNGDTRLGFLTDTGETTTHIESMLSGCHALVLECNHDRAMLDDGPYPPSLKERIGGRRGHLDNATAALILSRLESTQLQHLVAAHLSETNNTPELARAALARAIGSDPDWIAVADQDEGLEFRELAHGWH